MKKLILHIGPHKTGSTYLQVKLMKNRDKLNEIGFVYPEQFFHVFGHHHLYTKMFNPKQKSAYIQEITTLNELDSNVILSSENFSTQSELFFENIKNDLKYDEVVVVYYYRSPSDRLYSYWQEQIKHGSSEMFAEYTLPKFSRPYSDPDLNLLKQLEKITKIFGKESIRILDYEKVLKSNSSVFSFFEALGIVSPIEDTKEVVNAVLPESLIEIIRILNAKRKISEGVSDLKLREMILKSDIESEPDYLFLKEYIDSSCVNLQFGDTYIDRQVHRTILEKYASSIVGQLTEPRPKNRKVPRSDWLLNRECESRIESLYAKFKPS